MRANLATYFYAARPRFAHQSHTSGCSEVLAMNRMIAKFREQNVAHYYRFFAGRGPARQPEERAPVAFVHDAIADQIVVLTMIEHGQINHTRVFDRASHHLVILNAMTIIRDRYNASLREGSDRRELLPCEIFRDCAGWQNLHARDGGGPIFDPRTRARIVRDRRRINHANNG